MKPEEMKAPKEKFVLVNENKKLHDKELVTKPIGFFKDAMYRFSRNKGSIVGAIVIGLLVLYAIIAPIFSPYTVSYNDAKYRFTLPKLFNSETIDFLDGAANKTLNENRFLYYYSMGAETGHNAIKRQQYSYNEDTQMYTFRLDSYQSPGTVFMTGITESQYQAIQDYQDRTGIQVIYPITDTSKRPVQAQDKDDANYWFETKVDGSLTVPDNYTINADGSITFSNIYKEYTIPALTASRNEQPAYIKAVDRGDGTFSFTLSFYEYQYDEDGNVISETLVDDGYFAFERRFDTDYPRFVDEIEHAAKFTYDDVYNTLNFELTGHEDASKDGTYYFAIKSSTVYLRPISVIDEDEDYVPVSLYANDEAVDHVEDGAVYYVGNRKVYENKFINYLTGLKATGVSCGSAFTSALKVQLVASDGGYIVRTSNDKFVNDLHVEIDKDDVFQLKIGEGTVWTFDAENSALHATFNGFRDASKNGDYYLATNVNPETSTNTIELVKKEEIENNAYIDYLKITDNNQNPIAVIETNKNYYLRSYIEFNTYSYFCISGNFNGDNYYSRMRIEGEGNYIYSYALAKAGHSYEIRVNYYEYYIYYHSQVLHDRINQPYFLFGTTSYGQDIFTCLASGARFSFVLAIIVALVNMIVGAIYGAIEGYYGGKVDLVMERIVEILSAVPFMIVITLLKYHMGGTSHALILFIAFFLTGWIGMSGTVRMQFYRFKNQEYVLASRTLGAKDWRIMFKHIFPNALGTIVTSSVLVIPGMIFSETSLSYLGIINLNSGNMTSVGTLLANAQPYLVTYPHMIVFPAIFISLLMLCFNLFGNGLRDAFNPSLRGTED